MLFKVNEHNYYRASSRQLLTDYLQDRDISIISINPIIPIDVDRILGAESGKEQDVAATPYILVNTQYPNKVFLTELTADELDEARALIDNPDVVISPALLPTSIEELRTEYTQLVRDAVRAQIKDQRFYIRSYDMVVECQVLNNGTYLIHYTDRVPQVHSFPNNDIDMDMFLESVIYQDPRN